MLTPTFAVVVNNPTDQAIITTTDVTDYNSWFNVAYPIQIRWKTGDSSLLSTSTSESTLTPTKGSGGGVLNTSSIVIVAIVVVLVVISAVVVTMWWTQRKRLKRQAAPAASEAPQPGTGAGIQPSEFQPSELHDQGVLIPFLLKPLVSPKDASLIISRSLPSSPAMICVKILSHRRTNHGLSSSKYTSCTHVYSKPCGNFALSNHRTSAVVCAGALVRKILLPGLASKSPTAFGPGAGWLPEITTGAGLSPVAVGKETSTPIMFYL